MTSDPPNLAPEAREQEIERLAQELGRLIQGADPERRHDLKELAIALMREEFIHKDEPAPGAGTTPAPFNPLGTGVLLFFFGRRTVVHFWSGRTASDVERRSLCNLGWIDQLA